MVIEYIMSLPKTNLTYAGLADRMGNNIPELGAGAEAITMRKSSNGFFMLDSADRNLTGASAASGFSAEAQPWNNFRITKPQPLLDGFVKGMGATEVRFPWAIPNITPVNNTMELVFLGSEGVGFTVTLTPGFYNGTELATAIQDQFDAWTLPVDVDPPTIAYDTAKRIFTITPGPSDESPFVIQEPNVDDTQRSYRQSPSLMRTLGLTIAQLGVWVAEPITTSTTFITYTDYVDIISNRLCYDSDIKDGDSSEKTVSDLICRIYLADEISNYAIDPPGTRPFIIHRQYVTPKYLKLNPTQFFNSIDIQVRDMYGNLVPLLDTEVRFPHTYPDFQITFVSSSD